jgi:hypothetical protein
MKNSINNCILFKTIYITKKISNLKLEIKYKTSIIIKQNKQLIFLLKSLFLNRDQIHINLHFLKIGMN